MTKLLDTAIEKTHRLPANRQDDAAKVLLTIVEQSDADAPSLTPEQIVGVHEAIAEADAGDLVGKV